MRPILTPFAKERAATANLSIIQLMILVALTLLAVNAAYVHSNIWMQGAIWKNIWYYGVGYTFHPL